MIAWFDIFSGISGDMTLGAFIDLGVPVDWLRKSLGLLSFSSEQYEHGQSSASSPYIVRCENVMRNGIKAVNFFVDAAGSETGSCKQEKSYKGNHSTDKGFHTRNYRDIKKLILKSQLSPKVKSLSLSAFEKIAAAESQIHGLDIDNVHFHEVGAIDSIVDIVGSFLCVEFLGITEVYASEIPLGKGFVKCSHGTLPVPAPAVLEILKGVPVKYSGVGMELVTPTGAAIIKTLALGFGQMPNMVIDKTGYGAGKNLVDSDIPNLLRVVTGTGSDKKRRTFFDYAHHLKVVTGIKKPEKTILSNDKGNVATENTSAYIHRVADTDTDETGHGSACCKSVIGVEEIFVVETSVDDMNPEFFGYLMDRLFDVGALDVCYIPVHMKKNRPGTRLEAICRGDKLEEIIDLIFNETTTTGVRYTGTARAFLERKNIFINTSFGKIQVKKITRIDGREKIVPEYEVCRNIAVEKRIPLRDVYTQVCLDIDRGRI